MPPEEQIGERRLARYVRLPSGGHAWATIHPERFPQILQNRSEDGLELRLQIVLARASENGDPHQLSNADIALEIPLSASPLSINTSINPGRHPTTDYHGNSSNNLAEAPAIPPGSAALSAGACIILVLRALDWLMPSSLPQRLPPRNIPSSSNSSIRYFDETTETNVVVSFDKGVNAFFAGRYSEARTRFQMAAKWYHEQADTLWEANSLCQLGTAFCELKDYEEAHEHLSNARSMYKSLGDNYLVERRQCDRHLARVEEDSGNTEVALSAYQTLIQKTKEEQLDLQHLWCCYYLGRFYNRTGQYDEARRLLRDVFNTSRKMKSYEIEGLVTENFGYTAAQEGLPQLAMDCYERALDVFRTAGNGKWTGYESRVRDRMNQLRKGPSTVSDTSKDPNRRPRISRLFRTSGSQSK